MQVTNIARAAEQLTSAAILGGSWRPGLSLLAKAAGAEAVLIARPSQDRLRALTSEGLDAAHSDLKLGKTPPFSANVLIPLEEGGGFVSDTSQSIRDRLHQVPIFRDYVVPVLNLPFRATASVSGPRDVGGIRMSFWRSEEQGPFSSTEADCLTTILPSLRTALMVAQQGLGLQVERETLVYRQGGELVFHLDLEGRVLERDHAAVLISGDPITIRNKRIIGPTHADQLKIENAIARAILLKPSSVVVALRRKRDCSIVFLMLIPVTGEAVEPLSPAAAIGVLVDPSIRATANQRSIEALRIAAELTPREADVVGRISVGWSLEEISTALQIGMGTTRNYLKSSMQKCGVHSQVELAALTRRFG